MINMTDLELLKNYIDQKEELFLLKGKIEALGVYINNDSYPKLSVIAKIFGLEFVKDE